MKQYDISDIRAAQNEAHALIAALEILAQNPDNASLERIRTHRDSTYNAVNKALGTKKRGSYKPNSQMITESHKLLLIEAAKFVFLNTRSRRQKGLNEKLMTGEVVTSLGLPLNNTRIMLRQLDRARIVSYNEAEESVTMHSDQEGFVHVDTIVNNVLEAFDAPLLR